LKHVHILPKIIEHYQWNAMKRVTWCIGLCTNFYYMVEFSPTNAWEWTWHSTRPNPHW